MEGIEFDWSGVDFGASSCRAHRDMRSLQISTALSMPRLRANKRVSNMVASENEGSGFVIGRSNSILIESTHPSR